MCLRRRRRRRERGYFYEKSYNVLFF